MVPWTSRSPTQKVYEPVSVSLSWTIAWVNLRAALSPPSVCPHVRAEIQSNIPNLFPLHLTQRRLEETRSPSRSPCLTVPAPGLEEQSHPVWVQLPLLRVKGQFLS